MSKHRRAARVDDNQKKIVDELLGLPGIDVEKGHDDILVGFRGRTFWIEIKSDRSLSKKTGKVREKEITKSEKKRRDSWPGQYDIVSSTEEILRIIGYVR